MWSITTKKINKYKNLDSWIYLYGCKGIRIMFSSNSDHLRPLPLPRQKHLPLVYQGFVTVALTNGFVWTRNFISDWEQVKPLKIHEVREKLTREVKGYGKRKLQKGSNENRHLDVKHGDQKPAKWQNAFKKTE